MIQSALVISPDGDSVLGVVRDKDCFYAGYVFNSGVSKTWVIEYDDDFSFDENLSMMLEYIDEHYN